MKVEEGKFKDSFDQVKNEMIERVKENDPEVDKIDAILGVPGLHDRLKNDDGSRDYFEYITHSDSFVGMLQKSESLAEFTFRMYDYMKYQEFVSMKMKALVKSHGASNDELEDLLKMLGK